MDRGVLTASTTWWRRLRLVVAFCVAGGGPVACKKPPGPPPPIQEVVASFGAMHDSVSAAPDVLPALRLYIDGSQSMRGFVNRPPTTYSQVLRSILERAITAGYALTSYRLTDRVVRLQGLLASETTAPGFYDGNRTSLSGLFRRIAAGQDGDAHSVSMVVSDLVQSEDTADQMSLVDALQEVIGRYPEVMLLCFRSDFHGYYYVETVPRHTIELHLSMSLGEGRAFYLLVLAPSREAMRDIHTYILGDLNPVEVFRPSEVPLLTTGAEFVAPACGSESGWNRYGAIQADPKRIAATFVDRDARGSRSDLTIRLKGLPKVGVKSLNDCRYQVERVTFRRMGRERSPVQESAGISPRSNGTASALQWTMAITYPFARPDPFTWDAYRVRVRPGRGSLAVPDWVERWSTNDDGSPGSGSRTLHLALLVESMVRGIMENQVFTEKYILLGRGD